MTTNQKESSAGNLPEKKFFSKYKHKKLPRQFVYRSDINKDKLNVSQIKKILKENNVL